VRARQIERRRGIGAAESGRQILAADGPDRSRGEAQFAIDGVAQQPILSPNPTWHFPGKFHELP
jgi:hypothetical protein